MESENEDDMLHEHAQWINRFLQDGAPDTTDSENEGETSEPEVTQLRTPNPEPMTELTGEDEDAEGGGRRSTASGRRLRRWCFTIWTIMKADGSGTADDISIQEYNEDSPVIRYYCYQIEGPFPPVPPQRVQRVQVQGYIEFSKALCLGRERTHARGGAGAKGVFGTKKVHLEGANGDSVENKIYCSKQNTDGNPRWLTDWNGKVGRLPGTEFVEFGTPADGKVTAKFSFDECQAMIDKGATFDEIKKRFPGGALNHRAKIMAAINHYLKEKQENEAYRNVYTEIRWGAPGTGKTFGLSHLYNKVMYRAIGDGTWWDGYDPQKHRILLIDEFIPDQWSLPFLNRILDVEPIALPIKGGFTFANWEAVYICSNINPADWWPEAKKTKVRQIDAPPWEEELPAEEQHPMWNLRRAFFDRIDPANIIQYTGPSMRSKRHRPSKIESDESMRPVLPKWLVPDGVIGEHEPQTV